jgi:phospholipase C
VIYTVGNTSADLPGPLKLDVSTLNVTAIKVVLGPGVKLGAAIPTVRLTIAVSGAAKIKAGPATLATGKVRGGKFDMEVGMKLDTDGTPRIVTSVPDSPFDIDISTGAKATLVAIFGLGGLIGGETFDELAEHRINGAIVKGVRSFLAEPTIAPRILMLIFGAHFTYKPFRIENDQFVFDHVAPVEPEPKPTPGYHGAIGRTFTQPSPDKVTFSPPDLGDTWRANNLINKIKHIVVVMMENRSYDHVLGYRSPPGSTEGADGLSQEVIQAIGAADDGRVRPPSRTPTAPRFHVRNLKDAGFAVNEVGLKTRLPKGVGHALRDVAQQLSFRTTVNGGRSINSPRGFVENFKSKLKFEDGKDDKDRDGLDPDKDRVALDDVLGFYDQESLPMFDFLAKNYSYSDRYFCSHPGPTLPNRMYSLAGDLQHDRYGFPVLDNNNSDNFLLSRATTIYDLLTRNGVSYRVYESQPSVTMLRMFARYSTDEVNIVPIQQLKKDVTEGNLPDFAVIEPQMHAHPEDDDHPDADMHRGQYFLRDVYTTLTSNANLWRDTLLIITYDEHGGLYDHVVPPLADVFVRADGQAPGAVGGGTGPATLIVPYGVRVPTFVVSPWTTSGKVNSELVLDHCSILKTVLARFLGAERPFLSDRVEASHSFEAFVNGAEPRMEVGPLPDMKPPLSIGVRLAPSPTSRIVTPPLSRAEMRAGPVDYHELSGRWARQLGR